MEGKATNQLLSEVQEAKMVNEDYKIWKKNAPFLYDCIVTHALEWPSLTVQFFPDKTSPPNKDYTQQRLLMGTHTSGGEQNQILIGRVRLPKQPSSSSGRGSSEGKSEDGDSGEVGSYTLSSSGKIEIIQRINHQGEVNRARYMPQNPEIIATKSPSGNVFVFDWTKHPSQPSDSDMRCEFLLRGHEKEGYGLDWSTLTEGLLASGSEDNLVCVWNLNAQKPEQSGGDDTPKGVKPGAVLNALHTLRGHEGTVEDVAWHPTDANILASVGDDQQLILWDTRTGSSAATVRAHQAEVNCVSMNPFNPYLCLTGSADRTVALWDIRKLDSAVHSFEAHTQQVYKVQWSPFSEVVFASAGADRRVMLWDLSRIGEKLDPEDAKDGPPELLFIHGGHTDTIADFSWNANDDWMVASVADDNVVQLWMLAENIYANKQ